MSGWAVTEIGEEQKSAWDFRTLFLSDNIIFDDFYCPFCYIPLFPKLIYKKEELSKNPHFSIYHGKPHLFNCDGEPIIIEEKEKKVIKAHYIPTQMEFPQALIARPSPRVRKPSSLPSNPTPPKSSEEDVEKRRKKGGILGESVPRTYLLQSIVEARNIILVKLYEIAKTEKWEEKKKNEEFKKTLSNLPLSLGEDTNYDDAFRSPKVVNWNSSRIYYSNGYVELINHKTFMVSSSATNFSIIVDFSNVTEESPRMHNMMIAQLSDYARKKEAIKFFAYGKAINSDGIKVVIKNMDHFYFKKGFIK